MEQYNPASAIPVPSPADVVASAAPARDAPSAAAIMLLFQTAGHAAMLAAMVATVFAFQGARTATATYSAELFPTEIRATSYSLTVQLLGRITALLTPVIIGALSRSLGGLGNAVAVVSIGPVIGAILVALFAPETRGKRLEDLAPAAG